MKPHNQEFYDSKHHASNDDLIDYMGGRLSETTHDRIQSHLVECDECLDLFRDVRDFFESHREGEQVITANIAHEWKSLWERAKDEKEVQDRLVDVRRNSLRNHPWVSFALAATLLVVVALGIWALRQRWQKQPLAKHREGVQQRSDQLQTEPDNSREIAKEPEASGTPSPIPKQSPSLKEMNPLIAQATWSVERNAALRAISLEPTRGEIQVIDMSSGETRVFLSVPLYDDQGRTYSSYRFTLSAPDARLWQRALRAPKVSLTGYAHILDLLVFTRRLPQSGSCDLNVEGSSQGVWRPVGKVRLKPKEQ